MQDFEDFLTQLARKHGKLLRGNEPDLNTAAKGVLHDWARGRLPHFCLPPDDGAAAAAALPAEGRALAALPPLAELPEELRAVRQDMRELEPHVAAATETLERAEAGGDGSDVEEERTRGDDGDEGEEGEAAAAAAAAGESAGQARKRRRSEGGASGGSAVQWDEVFDGEDE